MAAKIVRYICELYTFANARSKTVNRINRPDRITPDSGEPHD